MLRLQPEQLGRPSPDSLAAQLESAATAADRSQSEPQRQPEAACSVSSSLDGALDDVTSAADGCGAEPHADVLLLDATAAAASDSGQWAGDADGRRERAPPLRQQHQRRPPLLHRSSSSSPPLLEGISSAKVAGGSSQPPRSTIADRALLTERQPAVASALSSPSSSLDGCAGLDDHVASEMYATDDRRPPNGPGDSPNSAADASSHHVGKVALQQQQDHMAAEVAVHGDLDQPAIMEEYIVRVRGLVMERDKATDLWAPGRHYPWCIVGLLQRHPICNSADSRGSTACSPSEGTGPDQVGADSAELSSGASPLEYVIRGRRLHDSEEIISCTVNSGLQYSVANPTFHHWTATDGTNRGCGVLFVNASDAARFEKHVRRALSHVSSCQVILPNKNAAAIPEGVAQVTRAPAAVSGTPVSTSGIAMPSPGVAAAAPAHFPAKAIAVNGGAVVVPVEESGGGSNNNNSWSPISRLPPRPQQPSSRGSHHHHLGASAAADSSSPALAPKAARSPQVTEFFASPRAAPRASSDDGLSAMYDYRTGELPGLPPASSAASSAAASTCADSGGATGSATFCRSRRAYTQAAAQAWPLADGEPRPQQSLQRRQQPQQQSVPSRANAPRDYRHVDGVETRRELPFDALDSHLVELKLPTRATKVSGRRRPRFALPRVRQLCCLAPSEENGGDNHLRRPSANGHRAATLPTAKRSHDHGFCCKRVGQCFGDEPSLPSDGGCDDNVELPAPSPRRKEAGRRGASGARGSPVARFLRRLFCSCWCLPSGGRSRSADRHRLRSSVSSASSSSAVDRQRGQLPVDNTVLSPPPSRRLTT